MGEKYNQRNTKLSIGLPQVLFFDNTISVLVDAAKSLKHEENET